MKTNDQLNASCMYAGCTRDARITYGFGIILTLAYVNAQESYVGRNEIFVVNNNKKQHQLTMKIEILKCKRMCFWQAKIKGDICHLQR